MQISTFHIFFLASMLTSLLSWGQVDSAYQLSTIEVKSTKIRQLPIGSPSQVWEIEDLEKVSATHIASLLSEEAGVYIKNYGMGSLATSSIRGGSSGHTLVLWNGLPVQSPMLGLLDLSFLPTAGVENVTFQKGGNTALWGSGAIGGLINLTNEVNFTNRFAVQNQTTTGSFGYVQQEAKIKFGNKKLQSSTKFFYEKSDNNFTYEIAPDLPKRQQTNADFKQRNILQDFYWQIDKKNQLAVHFWRQDIHRALPPSIVQTRSIAYQDDWSNRIITDWKHIGSKAIWHIKAGFFDEYQDFVNDLIKLQAHNHFQSSFGEITRQWNWRPQHQLVAGATYTYTNASSKNYTEAITENKSALFFSWKWNEANWAIQSSIRQELVDGQLVPIVPVVGLQYNIASFLELQFKVSKNYRLPTLNDRYWKPGGNSELQPESGWSEEASIHLKTQKDNWQFQSSITGFNRVIDNWILWTILDRQAFWSAHNLSKVWSRGLEPRCTITYQSAALVSHLKAGYDYIRSTNQVAIELPKVARGDQLLYTPIHQAFGKIDVAWKGWYGSYHHQFIGTTTGINEEIPAYQLGTFRCQYTTNYKAYQGKLFLTIQNAWDANYVVVERRPMAGQHYQMGIILNFKAN